MSKKDIEISPVENASLSEQVVDRLRDAILKGKLGIGERIVEGHMAKAMKTSRGPVRDALIQLEHEGLIIREPNRGAIVANLTLRDVEEVYTLRMTLEALALKYAIERATEEDLAKLEEKVDDLDRYLKGRFTVETAVHLDLKIHEELVFLSRNSRLCSIWQGLKIQMWLLIFSHNIYDIHGFPRDAATTHREIIDSIRRKDLGRGEELLREHMKGGYERLASKLGQEPHGNADSRETPPSPTIRD